MRGRIVIIGTGTGIGKTHVGVALVSALARAGIRVAGLKPVESGVGSGDSDAAALDAAATFHVKPPPPYALASPVSPHLAARAEGLTIQLEPIVRWVDESHATWTVIETAGALLSPLSSTLTNLDLTAALGPDATLLVAPDRLGVLHDLTATLFAYRTLAPRLPEPIVALQPPATPDTSTGLNGAELLGLGLARTVVTIPRGAPDSPAVRARAEALARVLGALDALA